MHFDSVLDSREALLAAFTVPKFKMRWLMEETRRKALRTLLITVALLQWLPPTLRTRW